MGLSARHLKEFQGKRFFSSVLFENAPQLGSQIYFLVLLGSPDEATVVALLSSTVSVILSVVDIWSAKYLVAVMKKQEKTGMNLISIEFNIDTNNQAHDEIEYGKRLFLAKPNHLKKALAQILVVHQRNIEMYQLMAGNPGIKVGFSVYAVDSTSMDTQSTLDLMAEDIKRLQLLIFNHWEMRTYPNVSDIREGHRKGSDLIALTPNTIKSDDGLESQAQGETYSTNIVGKGGRGRAPSKSSTYAAAKNLVRISQLSMKEMSRIKTADPELSLKVIHEHHHQDYDDEDEDSFDAELLWALFARLRRQNNLESPLDGNPGNTHFRCPSYTESSMSPKAQKMRSYKSMERMVQRQRVQSYTDENTADGSFTSPTMNLEEARTVSCRWNLFGGDGCVEDEQWNQYMSNIEKLISFQQNECKESECNPWMLSLQNMSMLLKARTEMREWSVFKDGMQPFISTANKEKSITEYHNDHNEPNELYLNAFLKPEEDEDHKEILSMINEMMAMDEEDDDDSDLVDQFKQTQNDNASDKVVQFVIDNDNENVQSV